MRLSEMSDAELKEHYKKLEEEKERRKRIQEEIRREKMPRIREETQLEYNMRIYPNYYRGKEERQKQIAELKAQDGPKKTDGKKFREINLIFAVIMIGTCIILNLCGCHISIKDMIIFWVVGTFGMPIWSIPIMLSDLGTHLH